MPFTPFHLGPAAAIKVIGGSYFSFMVFGYSQVLMDIEPLIRIIRNDAILHGVTHTYIGAIIIGIIALFSGRPISEFALRVWNSTLSPRQVQWFFIKPEISGIAALTGAMLGTTSHVFLDSLMHSDMEPFFPFSAHNIMINFISIGYLHLFCITCGVFGVIALLFLYLRNKWAVNI